MRSVRVVRCFGGMILGALALASCQPGQLGMSRVCPQLQSYADPLSLSYSANATANAKIRAFVAAAKSLVNVSQQMEQLASDSCLRMGADLGLSPAQLAPQSNEPGARVQAAC